MKTIEKTIGKNEYLKSVVEQYYNKKSEKPTRKGWKLLEEGDKKGFEQIMKEYRKMKKTSDKVCVILKAVEKANTETRINAISKEIASTNDTGRIINIIDTAYPDSQIARKIIETVHAECYTNMARKTSEIIERAKELRDIIKSFNL
ncbi:MAG: hypothetical protein QXK21_00510 [Candidatus Micrarchaeia archaeon]